jgi:hypothetical protein
MFNEGMKSILRQRVAVVFAAVLFLLLAPSPSIAQSSCVDLFRTLPQSGRQVLERLDDDLRGQLLQGQSVETVRAKMGLIRKLKLRELVKQLELSRLHQLNDYSAVVSNLHALFVEPSFQPADIFRFLSRKDAARRFDNWVRRQLILKGVKGLADDARIEDPAYKSILSIALRDLKFKLAKFKTLPFVLPVREKLSSLTRDQEIPGDLLARVLENGIDAERPALEAIYGQQNQVDLAKALRPYVNFVGFVVLSSASQWTVDQYVHHKAAQNGAALVEQLQSNEQGFDELVVALKEQKRAAQMQQNEAQK